MELFKVALQNHTGLRRATFKRYYVRYHALYGGDMRVSSARYGVGIGIEAYRDCAWPERVPPQIFVEDNAFEQQRRKMAMRSYHLHVAIKLGSAPSRASEFQRSIRCRGKHPAEQTL